MITYLARRLGSAVRATILVAVTQAAVASPTASSDTVSLGMTGCSGGGLTAYVMARDAVVMTVAPACYVSTFERLLDTFGPQDAEQMIHGQLRVGLDHPGDPLMRPPRPTLVSTTSGDYRDAAGTHLPFQTAERVGAVGKGARRTERVVLRGGVGGPLPALLVRPEGAARVACLVLHDADQTAALEDDAIDAAVDRGLVVVTLDRRGQGETARRAPAPLLGDWRTFSLAYLLGKFVVGTRSEDIIAAAWVATKQGGPFRPVEVVASGATGVTERP